MTKLLYRKALSKKLQIITYLQKKTVTDQKPIPVCITCPSGSERMDFAHALDCAHEVGVLADWGKTGTRRGQYRGWRTPKSFSRKSDFRNYYNKEGLLPYVNPPTAGVLHGRATETRVGESGPGIVQPQASCAIGGESHQDFGAVSTLA